MEVNGNKQQLTTRAITQHRRLYSATRLSRPAMDVISPSDRSTGGSTGGSRRIWFWQWCHWLMSLMLLVGAWLRGIIKLRTCTGNLNACRTRAYSDDIHLQNMQMSAVVDELIPGSLESADIWQMYGTTVVRIDVMHLLLFTHFLCSCVTVL